MNLYEVLSLSEADYDTYDTDYDASVTACYIDEADAVDSYDKFCISIMKKIEVARIIPNSHIICEWSKLIQDNMENFKAFTEEYWENKYEDDEDEFIYQWINEIHLYMAGYVSDDFYDILVEFVEDLKA